jgi:hypothetical protein
MRPNDEQRAEVLFDLLADADRTRDEIQAKTAWNRPQFQKAVQTLRDILAANGDVISVVCEPHGHRAPWLYCLRAGAEVLNAEESRWIINRLQDAERRLLTIGNVMEVAARGLDGRSIEGRKARIYELHIRRAAEEVALLDGGDAA